MRHLKSVLLGSSAIFTLAIAQGATAQEADASSSQVGEVIVTATRQAQSLSKVPVSVAAYSEDQLQLQGVKSIDGIARFTPGVTIGRGNTSPLGATVTIRGISAGGVGASTTGIYIDDTPIQARSIGFSSASTFPVVFDLERVEILRGPQGTLFGAGAEGGAIRFLTPQPSFTTYRGAARAELATIKGGSQNYEGGMAFGGPIVADKLAFRASGFYRKDGGFVDRVPQGQTAVADEDANWSSSLVGRLAISWRPIESLTITPSVSYQKQKSNGTGAIWERESNPSKGVFINGNKRDEPFADRFVLPALKVTWNLGAVDLVSNTSMFSRESFGINDYTITNAATWSGTGYLTPATNYFNSMAKQGNKQNNYNQELRLQSADPDARLNWVIGVYVERNKQSAYQETDSATFPQWFQQVRGVPFVQFFTRPLIAPDIYLLSNVRAYDKQQAVYANVDFKLTEKLKLTAGARYAKTSFRYEAEYDGPTLQRAGFNEEGSNSEKPFTPKVGASYQIDDGNMVYVSASKGFRPGGAQARNPPACQPELTSLGYSEPPTTFESDSVWSYELGSKNRLADGKVRIEASVFQIDFNNIQRSIALTSCARSFTANAGKARSRGFDLAVNASPMRGLTLGLALGYTNAQLSDDILGPTPAGGGARRILVGKGDSLGQRPWNVTINSEYSFPVMAGFDGFVRGDATYASAPARPSNLNPVTAAYDAQLFPAKGYTLVNARAGVRKDRLTISVFATNLFNETPIIGRGHGSRTSPLFTYNTETPRTVGVTVMKNF